MIRATLSLLLFSSLACAEPRRSPDGGTLDPAPLVAGEILVDANTSMKLPRGISARAVFFLPIAVEKAGELLPVWNPQPHPELEVLQFHAFNPDVDPGFETLRFDGRTPAVRKLLAAMRDRDGLQLTPAESAALPAAPTAETAAKFWAEVLRGRWTVFQNQGLKVPAPGAFDARAEVRALLAEEPRVAAHFAALLASTPLETDRPGPPIHAYWQAKVINGVAGVSLGITCRRENQFADLEFYVSSGYLVACTLFEVSPHGGGTIVWQENFASSPLLTGGFGIKRKLATLAIESDARRSIRALRRDFTR